MKIVHVNDVAFVGATLVEGLVARGVDAVLVRPAEPFAGGSALTRALSAPVRAVSVVGGLRRVRGEHADLVHVHNARHGVFGLAARRPFVLHCHGTDVRGVVPGRGWGRVVAPAMARASCVLFATPDLAADVGRFRDDAELLPNPVDTSLFRPAEVERSGDVLVASRASDEKGVDVVIGALRALVAARSALRVTVVAFGPRRDEVVAAAGRHAQVVGHQARTALADLYRTHAVALGQFALGAIGMTELECLASGTPVVARFDHAGAYPAPPPVLPAATVDDAVERVLGILDDESAWHAASSAGVAWVAEHHGRDVVAARLAARYEEILARAVS